MNIYWENGTPDAVHDLFGNIAHGRYIVDIGEENGEQYTVQLEAYLPDYTLDGYLVGYLVSDDGTTTDVRYAVDLIDIRSINLH